MAGGGLTAPSAPSEMVAGCGPAGPPDERFRECLEKQNSLLLDIVAVAWWRAHEATWPPTTLEARRLYSQPHTSGTMEKNRGATGPQILHPIAVDTGLRTSVGCTTLGCTTPTHLPVSSPDRSRYGSSNFCWVYNPWVYNPNSFTCLFTRSQ
jgi:hypothetical protein